MLPRRIKTVIRIPIDQIQLEHYEGDLYSITHSDLHIYDIDWQPMARIKGKWKMLPKDKVIATGCPNLVDGIHAYLKQNDYFRAKNNSTPEQNWIITNKLHSDWFIPKCES